MLIDIQDNVPDKRLRRQKDWRFILIHHTGMQQNIKPSAIEKVTDGIINWLSTEDNNYASAHYVIKRNGVIVRLVDPDLYEAMHAGDSEYYDPQEQKKLTSVNQYAIGIELIGDGNIIPYTDEQYKSLIDLCVMLIDRYKTIQPNLITGHENVCVPKGRKVDPGKFFNWDRFFSTLYLVKK